MRRCEDEVYASTPLGFQAKQSRNGCRIGTTAMPEVSTPVRPKPVDRESGANLFTKPEPVQLVVEPPRLFQTIPEEQDVYALMEFLHALESRSKFQVCGLQDSAWATPAALRKMADVTLNRR